MANEKKQPIHDNFDKVHKAAKIGSLVMGAVLTTMEIISVVRDGQKDQIRL
ncbi:hypothetical protein H8E88_10310 [candidate division KSB1 bacterium]|nr:hypothetical protein [candidate division KSB1 bacterium]